MGSEVRDWCTARARGLSGTVVSPVWDSWLQCCGQSCLGELAAVLWSAVCGTVGCNAVISPMWDSWLLCCCQSCVGQLAAVLWSVMWDGWLQCCGQSCVGHLAAVLWSVLCGTVGCSAVVSPVWDIWL